MLNQCARISLDISFVSEEGDAEGLVVTKSVVESHHVEVCTCDDLHAEAQRFCSKYQISNCQVTYDRLLDAVHKQIFDGVPYDLLSLLEQGKGGAMQEIEPGIEGREGSTTAADLRAQSRARTRKYKGWTKLPEPFNRLLADARGACHFRNK